MQYRVEELARAAGVRVDTVRFYQNRGLLPPPEHRGRIAVYSREHLERLRRIRLLSSQGLKLEGVRRVLDDESRTRAAAGARGSVRGSLLRAVSESAPASERTYTRAQIESTAQLPGFLIRALEEIGLIAPQDERYGEADRITLESAHALLDAGLPLPELLELARAHVDHVERVAERAVALFEARTREQDADASPEQIADTFRALLPAALRLVSVHFERTLLGHARARLSAAASGAGKESR